MMNTTALPLVRVRTVMVALAVSMLSVSQGAESVTTESLLREMSDRTALARLPSPAYRSLQASSYDRISKKPGTVDWSANRDYSQFLRTEVIAIAKTQDNRQGVFDLAFLDAKGRGVMVGDSITLFSGAARWWGEGDEKI